MEKRVSNNDLNPNYPTKSEVNISASRVTKGIASAIMAASVTIGAAGCGDGKVGKALFEKDRNPRPVETYELAGAAETAPTEEDDLLLMGEETAPTEEFILDGDIAEPISEDY